MNPEIAGASSSSASNNNNVAQLLVIDSLRNEVKTKDLALWLAHFENKKERKKCEIAETKTAKMADRIQKLMFICERHRKEVFELKSRLERLEAVRSGKRGHG